MIFREKEILLKDGRKCLLRSPRVEDAEGMLDFLKTVAGETEFILRYPEEVTLTIEQEIQYILSKNEAEGNLIILAFVDGELAGNCHLGFVPMRKVRHRGTIGVSVKRKFWNQGIGTVLIRELILFAKASGILQLELEVVEGNERAIALYKKMGFRVYGEIPRGVVLKDGTSRKMIQMVKFLDQSEGS